MDCILASAEPQESGLPPFSPDKVSPTILMVDDDASMRMLFEVYLTAFGYTPLFAAGGEEALRIARESPEVRAVIFDLVMPGLSGPELARQLGELLPGAAFLVCSGHPERALERLGLVVKGARFIQKPCRPMELKQHLSEMLPVR